MHVLCHIHSTWPSHSHSFFAFLILMFGSRYNLWSNILCSFLQVPINFSHKILRPDQHCWQTQSTLFPQYHRQSITPTFMIIPGILTCTYISIVMFPETRKKFKTFSSCSENFSKLTSSQFLDSATFFLNSDPIYIKLPTFLKFQTVYQPDHICLWCDIPNVPQEYIRLEMVSQYCVPSHISDKLCIPSTVSGI